MYFYKISVGSDRFGFVILKSLQTVVMLFIASLSLLSCNKQKGVSAGAARSSEIAVSGTVNDEEAVNFTQANDSVSISGVNLLATTSYEVTAYSLLSDGSKTLIYRGNFSQPTFSFKSRVPLKFLSIEVIRQPDGARFGSVLPPVSKSRSAKVSMDRTTSIAFKLMTVILDQAQKGDVLARSAINDAMISIADLLVLAQSVRRTVDEQKSSKQGQAIDLKALASALVEKSIERFETLIASGESAVSISEKLSEASYVTIFGVAADTASPGILAYRTDPGLGSSEAAKVDVAYAAIKAVSTDAMKPVDEAFRAESAAYRTAPNLVAAVASEGSLVSNYQTTFSNCMSAPNSCATSSFTPPQPSSVDALSLPKFKVCSSNGEIGCITTAQYKAADLTNLSAGNIKLGVTIAGVVGIYPTPPDPWDVRVGKTINGVNGKLKVNCRNRVNSGLFNYDNPGSFAIGRSGRLGGEILDIWDTIDDYNSNQSGLPTGVVTAWGSNTDCGGKELTFGDDNVWRDVTTNANSGPSNCVNDAARCTMQDKITGLWWSAKLQPNSMWDEAWDRCLSLEHNGQTGWRLPTAKELMEAASHGIRSVATEGWINNTDMANRFWSGTSRSNSTSNAFTVTLGMGTLNDMVKHSYDNVTCVR